MEKITGYLFIPQNGKSFDLAAKMYANANNIPPDRIFYFNGTFSNPKSLEIWCNGENIPLAEFKKRVLPKNKNEISAFIFPDDASGTGKTFTDRAMFRYDYNDNPEYGHLFELFKGDQDKIAVAFSPVKTTDYAKQKINDMIKNAGRTGKDFMISEEKPSLIFNGERFDQLSRKELREKGFSNSEITALEMLFKETGYQGSRINPRTKEAICLPTVTPWQVSTNNSLISALFGDDFMMDGGKYTNQLLDPEKKVDTLYMNIRDKIREKLAEYTTKKGGN